MVDVDRDRLTALTLLCAPQLWTPSSALSAPPLAARRQEALSQAAAKKAFAPLAGELWALALSTPGGVPLRKRASPEGSTFPSLAIVKKMRSGDWELAKQRASAFGSAVASAFPSLIESSSMGEACVQTGPGAPDEQELRAFERLAWAAASDWMAATAFERKGPKP